MAEDGRPHVDYLARARALVPPIAAAAPRGKRRAVSLDLRFRGGSEKRR